MLFHGWLPFAGERLPPHATWESLQQKNEPHNLRSLKPSNSSSRRRFPDANANWQKKRVWKVWWRKSEHFSIWKEKFVSFPCFKARLWFCRWSPTDNWWWTLSLRANNGPGELSPKSARAADWCMRENLSQLFSCCSNNETLQKHKKLCSQFETCQVLLPEPDSSSLAFKKFPA